MSSVIIYLCRAEAVCIAGLPLLFPGADIQSTDGWPALRGCAGDLHSSLCRAELGLFLALVSKIFLCSHIGTCILSE